MATLFELINYSCGTYYMLNAPKGLRGLTPVFLRPTSLPPPTLTLTLGNQSNMRPLRWLQEELTFAKKAVWHKKKHAAPSSAISS